VSNTLYGKGRQKFGEASIHWVNDDIRAVLIDLQQYTPQIDVDEFLSDIPVGARTSVSGPLTGKTNVLGVLDADDVTFPLVTGAQSELIALYKHTGVASTSPLLVLIDTATGLAVTPSGGNIITVWDNGPNKIVKL
jgi:hypothetical protein